ncbi:peptide chain release factor N(5)-glutamine methyltransferase [Acidimicrobium ferrooxidans]|nr:peptide chain release factor N(5)-glutamine methyltransferase [Acidimicrobium ferrooxidans]
MSRTVLELIRLTENHFSEKGIESSRLDAELLLAHVLGCERIQLYSGFDRPLDEGEISAYRDLVRRRANRAPCAYLIGRRWFYTHELEVTPDVLIPRPETETLVEVALDRLREDRLPEGPGLDLGTGSGAIAIVLCSHRPELRMVASDCSLAALAVARRNVESSGLSERIQLVGCSGFSGLQGPFAWICSNPPYLCSVEPGTMIPLALQPEVHFEPDVALFAGVDGLDVLREIFEQAPDQLLPGGFLLVECDPQQVATLCRLGEKFGTVRVVQDLTGRERVVQVIRK